MLRNMIAVFLAIVIATGAWGCVNGGGEGSGDGGAGGDGGEIDTTEHDNLVQINAWSGDVQLAFTLSGHSITSGQPWGGVQTSDGLTIDVKAGRHASGSVADWFRSNCSAALCDNWPADCPQWPSELNFAVTGTFTINGTGYPITIGQGSVDHVHNNWWVGGPGWTLKFSYGSAIVTPDGKYYFEPVDDNFNQFSIFTSM